MNQSEIITAPKTDAIIPSGVIGKPSVCGAFNSNIMKEIKLSQKGKYKGMFVALVDDVDYEYINQWRWSVTRIMSKKGMHQYYAKRTQMIPCRKSIMMHRLIMETIGVLNVDHIDHNGLNNQRSNLRNCTHSQNQFNHRTTVNGITHYLGVYKNKNRFYAQIVINGRQKHIGSYKTELEAAVARDKAAIRLRGEFANLNFKQSALH